MKRQNLLTLIIPLALVLGYAMQARARRHEPHRASDKEPGRAHQPTLGTELKQALQDEVVMTSKEFFPNGDGLLRGTIRLGVAALMDRDSSDPPVQRTSRHSMSSERPQSGSTAMVNVPVSDGVGLRVNAWQLVKSAFARWNEDHAQGLGAALAYYTVFSLAPLLLIVIAIAGLVFGQEAAQGQMMGEIQGLVGEESAKAIQSMVEAARKPAAGLLATLIATVMLLLGATGVFAQLQESLNIIWRVKEKPDEGIWKTLKNRFFSLLAVLGTGFLLLISLVISAGLSAMGKTFEQVLPGPELLLQLINFVVSCAVITLLFAMIYKLLPDTHIRWGDVWVGAGITSLLFTIGKFFIGLYLGKSDVGVAYGAAGSLVVILIWVYYASQIFLFGAEFTAVYAESHGARVAAAVGGRTEPVLPLARNTN